ncbi:MAG: hypothetical protein JJU28_04605 [Cyclobacteriaceae bacterium]|nr:hypothetical protein [Cyclobacteriaceae bacterium]
MFSLVMLCLQTAGLLQAQELSVKGSFNKDSTKIGEEVVFSLSVSYPRAVDLVFPDSTFNFYPFEFLKGRYFTTRSDSLMSFDSAVYYLATYEIEPVQKLRLPVYILKGKDSLPVFTKADSVFLIEMIDELPEEPVFLSDNTFFKIPAQFNHPYFFIGLGIFAFITLLVILFFGKKIRVAYKRWKIRKGFEKFILMFEHHKKELLENKNSASAEKLLSIWKGYLEKLDDKPYTKMTTREICNLYPGDDLKNSLRELDKSIYSGHYNGDTMENIINTLIGFTRERYTSLLSSLDHDR